MTLAHFRSVQVSEGGDPLASSSSETALLQEHHCLCGARTLRAVTILRGVIGMENIALTPHHEDLAVGLIPRLRGLHGGSFGESQHGGLHERPGSLRERVVLPWCSCYFPLLSPSLAQTYKGKEPIKICGMRSKKVLLIYFKGFRRRHRRRLHFFFFSTGPIL